MVTAKQLMSQVIEIEEERGRVKAGKYRVTDGKRTKDTRKTYRTECKPGYKRDSAGKCVRMKSDERRSRSKSAIKAGRKTTSKRKRARSNKKRGALGVK